MYYSNIDLPDDAIVSEENKKNWDAFVIECARPIIERAVRLSDTTLTISELKYFHPKYYNFETDEIEFTVSIDNDVLDKLIARVRDNREFIDFLKRFESHDGFISRVASTQDEFLAQCEKDPALSLAQIIYFNAKDSIASFQQEFELTVFNDTPQANLEWLPDEEIGESYKVVGYKLTEEEQLETRLPREFKHKDQAISYGKALSEALVKEKGTTYVECCNKANETIWESEITNNEDELQHITAEEAVKHVMEEKGKITILGKDNTDNFTLTKEDVGVVLDEVGLTLKLVYVICLNNLHFLDIYKT